MNKDFFILAINPGSTSTKIGLFKNDISIWQENIKHNDEELRNFKTIIQQKDFRTSFVRKVLDEKNFLLKNLSATVGRGGLLKPLKSGTYRINKQMLEDLIKADRGEHASNLGALIAFEIASELNIPSFIVDPVCVDELEDIARISGLVDIERESLSHALNTKSIIRRHAKKVNKNYKDLRLIVAHLGSGISISTHLNGKMIDVVNPREEGPFSPDRSGGLPSYKLVELCFSGKYDFSTIKKKIFGEGGIYSYLGTRDLRKVIEMINKNDEKAKLIFDAMIYQIAKYIGAMATVLNGNVDYIILTGGMTKENKVVKDLEKKVSFIAPVFIYPGEDELQALAEGTLRILKNEENEQEYL